jgi:hypothetical protein
MLPIRSVDAPKRSRSAKRPNSNDCAIKPQSPKLQPHAAEPRGSERHERRESPRVPPAKPSAFWKKRLLQERAGLTLTWCFVWRDLNLIGAKSWR